MIGRLSRFPLVVYLVLVAATAAADEPVYDLDASTELAVGATGVGLFGVGYLANRGFEPLTPDDIASLDPSEINRWDRTAVDNWSPETARVSDYLMIASAIAPVSLMLSEPGRNQANIIGVMYLETIMINQGLTYLLKNTFGRSRPFVYNDDPDIPRSLKMSRTARRSFPSGHTSSAFSALVFLASVHSRLHPDSGANGWVWGGCLAAAATTGYLRYASGWHFPTDILTGATVGAFAGWIVPHLHEWESSSGDPMQKSRPMSQTMIGFTLGF